MKENGIGILVVLALVGVGMAFAFVGLMMSGTSHEDVWMYQNPSKEEFRSMSMLSEEQRQKAIEIAKQNETVKQYLEQGYEIGGGSVTFGIISGNEREMESEYISLRKDKDWVFVDVDLKDGKVRGILKSRGEIAALKMREGGEIKAVNETEIRIAIGGREGKVIRAPEVRELTEEEREKAREIALSDPEVQNIISRMNYTMEIKPMGMIITNEVGEVETKFNGASVVLRLGDGTIYFVHVDLQRGKVIRTSPPIPPPETSGEKVDE